MKSQENDHPIERAKQRDALSLLEEAQGLVADAASAICSVDGLGDQWSDLVELHGSIREAWERLEMARPVVERNDQHENEEE